MHYIFKADESAAGNEVETTSAVADGDEIKCVAPRAWVGKAKPRLSESSFDPHPGLEMNEAEIDTVPTELLNDLFKPLNARRRSEMGTAKLVFRKLVLESPHGLGKKQSLVSMIYFDLHAPGATYISLRADIERSGHAFEVTKPTTFAALFDADAFVALAQAYLRQALSAGNAGGNMIEDSGATEVEIAIAAST